MNKSLFGILIFLFFALKVTPQSGNGHNPESTLSYIANKMRQDNGAGLAAKNIINDNNAAKLYVNFTFDTSNKNVYLQYTTDGQTPNKNNGSTVAASFDNYSDPNSTFYVLLPAQSAGTTVKYIFYISDGDLASSWGMIDSGNGYVTSWNEGTISPFSYNVFSEISSNTTWDDSTTLPLTRYDLTSNAILTLDNADFNISDLSVYNGSLVIEPSASIDISGTLTIFTSGTVTAKSNSLESASLITNSRSGPGSTNFYYEKYVAANDTTNDLIAPPFAGLSFTNTLANNPGVIKQDPSDSTKYLFGPFDNDNGIYLTYDSDTDGNQTMGVGKGYRVGTISGGGTVTFRGLFQNGNVGVLTSKGGHNLYGRWNLIGNPFACYIDLNHFLMTTKLKLSPELTMLCMPMMVMIVTAGLFGQFTMKTTLLVNILLLVKLFLLLSIPIKL